MDNVKRNLPGILCLIAGALMIGNWIIEFLKSDMDDVFWLAFGFYFLGKGFFVIETMTYQRKMLERV